MQSKAAGQCAELILNMPMAEALVCEAGNLSAMLAKVAGIIAFGNAKLQVKRNKLWSSVEERAKACEEQAGAAAVLEPAVPSPPAKKQQVVAKKAAKA